MKFLAAALLATPLLAAASLVAPASAAIISATFGGVVYDQKATAYTDGQTITGSFSYDTVGQDYTSFKIGTYAATAAYQGFVPAPLTKTFSAVFTDSLNPSVNPAVTTSTGFTLDLEYNTAISTTDLALLLNNASGFITDPTDPGIGLLAYQTQNADGTGVSYVDAYVSYVASPEPMTLALLGTAGAALFSARRRR